MSKYVRWASRVCTFVLIAAVAVVAGGVPAQAAVTGRTLFALQAQRAGLSTTKAAELQQEVDKYLAKTGGVQISANQIKYSGAVLTVAVPGEQRARDLTAVSSARVLTACPYYHVCLWQNANFTGSSMTLYYCNTWVYIPWASSDGSWDNNQTPGTKMGVRALIGSPWFSWPAYWLDSHGVRWDNILYMSAC